MKKSMISLMAGLLAPVAAFWTLTPVKVSATGFALPDQDAFATARGEAFVATADNPSAIYYNPAGLTQLQGNTLRAGVYGLYLDPTFQSPTTGASYDNSKNWHAVPQIYYAGRAESLPLGYGIGVFAPFGLSSKWPQDTGFRTLATEGSLDYFTINPAVAYEVLPGLSLGAGVTANYAKVDLSQGLLWPAQGFDEFNYTGDGWAVGYNLGLLWKVTEKVNIGVSFRSSTTVNTKGSTTVQNSVPLPSPPGPFPVPAFAVNQNAQADFPTPLKTIVGISYRPTPAWNLEFNADYTDWSRLGTITVEQAGPIPPLLAQNVPLVLNWQASWYYEFGITRYLENGWSLSAGYIYNENSVPDANYSPLVADLNRHFFSVGVGRRGERFDFDVAYQFGYGPDRTVSGSAPSATGQTADGTYGFISHALAVSVSWHF
jgi:long-chain fatty acid transport protein